MFAYCLGHRAKYHPGFGQLVFKGCRHGNRVEHRVHCHPGQAFLLINGDAQLVISFQQFRIDFIEVFRSFLLFRRGIITDGMIVDSCIINIGPARLNHSQPVAISLQTPLQHPIRFALFGRYDADHVFAQAGRDCVGIQIGDKTLFVFLADEPFYRLRRC